MDNPHHLYLEYNRVVRRQERIYRNLVDRQNPLEHFSDVEIFTNFRFRRDTLLDHRTVPPLERQLTAAQHCAYAVRLF